MAYWRLFYHLVWATHKRMPLISPEHEPIIHDFLKVKAVGLDATVFAINGMADHVHCVVSIPPSIAVANFVGQIKGITSAKFNTQFAMSDPKFAWQESYGAFSVDGKRLPHIIEYVQNQKQHHASHYLIPILERTDKSPVQLLRESATGYLTGKDTWWQEMLTLDS
jgi:putative transposase